MPVEPCSRAARAAPAAIERPWPSEPVEKSIPGQACSGWRRAASPSPAVRVELVGVEPAGRWSAAYSASAAWPFDITNRSRSGSSGSVSRSTSAVQRGEDVRDRERRSDVADIGALRLLEDEPANGGSGERLQAADTIARFGHASRTIASCRRNGSPRSRSPWRRRDTMGASEERTAGVKSTTSSFSEAVASAREALRRNLRKGADRPPIVVRPETLSATDVDAYWGSHTVNSVPFASAQASAAYLDWRFEGISALS